MREIEGAEGGLHNRQGGILILSMADRRSAPLAAVFGLKGRRPRPEERAFFKKADPLGIILFQRNCQTPDQVRALIDDFRECVGRADAPVLIDQEGGRVARLQPPHWRGVPSAMAVAKLADVSLNRAMEALYLNALLIARELWSLGVTVNCAPVMDVPWPGAHGVIGDRALGATPQRVGLLGSRVVAGLLDGGVSPVVKHMPGHGRAMVDSHSDLPLTNAGAKDLRSLDFKAFRHVRRAPWAMTAHVVYSAFDKKRPATISKTVIEDCIRGEIGFKGVLVSDDLSMKALGGDMRDRAAQCLRAGCDIALHCNGDMREMEAVAEGAGQLGKAALTRIAKAEKRRKNARMDIDAKAALDRFHVLIGKRGC